MKTDLTPEQLRLRTAQEKLALDVAYKIQERLPSHSPTCVECKAKAFFLMYLPQRALIKGHIYSEAGRAEFCMSGMCEYCFDDFTLSLEDPTPEVPHVGAIWQP